MVCICLKLLFYYISVTSNKCVKNEQSLGPQIYIFMAQIPGGIFGSLYDNLGIPYMDDNVVNAKFPFLMSVTSIVKMLGHPLSQYLASYSLKEFISPGAIPKTDTNDPRWLGAYWLGWTVIGFSLLTLSFLVSLFPRELPRAALRRRIGDVKKKLFELQNLKSNDEEQSSEHLLTLQSLLASLKRILTNRIFMINTISFIFYSWGQQPYWMFTQKYIETQYRESSSSAR